MRMKTFYFFLSLLFTGLFVGKAQFAQMKTINGKIVIDDEEDHSVEGINIFNLRSKTSSKTDEKGQFSIYTKIGDTIQFDRLGLVSRQIIVHPDLYARAYAEVHMNIEVIELNTAMVNPLRMDRFSDESDMTYLYRSLGIRKKLYKEALPKVVRDKKDLYKFQVGQILKPVELIGHLNGYYRKKRNLDFYENEAYFATKIKDYFPNDYFTDELKIPAEKIENFINYTIQRTNIKDMVNPERYFDIGLILEEYAPKYLNELQQTNE